MKTYVVVGLGRFGQSIARRLCELGNEVLAMDKNPEYAVFSERTVPRLRQILRELQFREYVEEKGEQYPVICLTPEGKAFMKTEEPLIMKLPKEETEKKSESKEKKNTIKNYTIENQH